MHCAAKAGTFRCRRWRCAQAGVVPGVRLHVQHHSRRYGEQFGDLEQAPGIVAPDSFVVGDGELHRRLYSRSEDRKVHRRSILHERALVPGTAGSDERAAQLLGRIQPSRLPQQRIDFALHGRGRTERIRAASGWRSRPVPESSSPSSVPPRPGSAAVRAASSQPAECASRKTPDRTAGRRARGRSRCTRSLAWGRAWARTSSWKPAVIWRLSVPRTVASCAVLVPAPRDSGPGKKGISDGSSATPAGRDGREFTYHVPTPVTAAT